MARERVGDDPDERGPTTPGAQAKEAMERAREAARSRGATPRSARQAARDRAARRRSSDPSPYGSGRDPRRVDSEIASLVERSGWSERLDVASVTARWPEIVGESIAEHCTDLSFDDGALTIRASSTAWATQLGLLAVQIRDRLNDEAGRSIVREVRVVGPTGRSWTKGPRVVRGRGPRDTYG